MGKLIKLNYQVYDLTAILEILQQDYIKEEMNIDHAEENIVAELGIEYSQYLQYHIVYFGDIKEHSGEIGNCYFDELYELQTDHGINDFDLVIIKAS